MSRIAVAALAVSISVFGFGCEDQDEPKLDPKLKKFDDSMKAKAPPPVPDAGPAAATEPAKADDGKVRVPLKWIVEKDKPLTVVAKVGSGGGAAIDPVKLAGGEAVDAKAIDGLLGGNANGSAMTAVLANDADSIAVRARADSTPPKDAKSPLDGALAALKSEGKIRADMTPRGFISTDLDRDLRNVLALMFELPPDPVAQDDSWHSSVKLLSAGPGFETVSSTHANDVRLSAMQADKSGRQIAVIDYVLAEQQKGIVGTDKDAKDATVAAAFIGRGKFSVTDGRWLSFDGRLVTSRSGGLSGNSDQRVSLALGGAAPADLLVDPPPKEPTIVDDEAPLDAANPPKATAASAKGGKGGKKKGK